MWKKMAEKRERERESSFPASTSTFLSRCCLNRSMVETKGDHPWDELGRRMPRSAFVLQSTVEYGYLHQTDWSIKISWTDSILAILLRFYWYLHQTDFYIKFAGTKVMQTSVFHCSILVPVFISPCCLISQTKCISKCLHLTLHQCSDRIILYYSAVVVVSNILAYYSTSTTTRIWGHYHYGHQKHC